MQISITVEICVSVSGLQKSWLFHGTLLDQMLQLNPQKKKHHFQMTGIMTNMVVLDLEYKEMSE